MCEKYYHLTTEENAKRILEEGLLPIHGEHKNMIHDEREGIFLCGEKDVPYWKIILGLSVVLEVSNIKIEEENIYNYSYYKEYVYEKKIESENIRRVKMENKKANADAMKDLCYQYLYWLSSFTVHCARYYFYDMEEEMLHESIDIDADCLLAVLPHLDYSICGTDEIKEFLIEEGDSGEYTICDKYVPTGHRLYVQLIHYPKDDLSTKRRKIYEYIKDTFKGCLRVHTGGWCG